MDMDKETRQRMSELKAAYEADKTNRESAIKLAEFYSDLGWYNQALKIYREILNNDENDFTILLCYGNLCFRKQDYKCAQEVFSRLTLLYPSRIEGWNNLGTVLLQLGRFDEAFEAFKKVLELEPDNPGALLNLGNCYDQKGQAIVARQFFEKAIKAKPDFVEAWFNLGNTFLGENNYDEAIKAFERCINYQREFTPALKNMGFAYEQSGNLDKAEHCYSKALQLNKTDPQLYVNLGNIYTKKELFDQAKNQYYAAVKIAPRLMEGWMGLRHLALLKGDISTFVQATLAVIARLPVPAIVDSVEVLSYMHHKDFAYKIIQEADKLGVQSEELDAQRLVAYQRNETSAAKIQPLLRRLCSIVEPSARIKCCLGEYFFLKGDFQKAIKYLQDTATISPYCIVILWQAMIKTSQLDKCIESIEAFLKDNHQFGEAWYCLAAAKRAKAELKEAKQCLKKALEFGFDETELIELDEELKELYNTMKKSEDRI